MGWFREKERPLTPATRLSRYVNQAAAEIEEEKEEMDAAQSVIRGLTYFFGECESKARLRGSTTAEAFKVLGQGTQAMAHGMARVVAALPPPNQRALEAARLLLGLTDDEESEYEDEKPKAPPKAPGKS